MDGKTKINNKTWDIVADLFFEASALPTWGPFSVGKNLKLINNIKGKTFLVPRVSLNRTFLLR